MRSGGPRLLCSPYFVVVLFVLLVFTSMRYYSLSTDNETLTLRVEVLQNQMKMTATNLKNLDVSMNKKSEALLDCNNDRIQAEEKSRKAQEQNEKKEDMIERLKDELNNKQKTLEKIQSENVNLYVSNDTITESIQKLQEELESEKEKSKNLEASLKKAEESSKKLQEDLEAAKSELSALKSEKVQGKETIGIKGLEQNPSLSKTSNQSNGQLPDVNPDAVHIRQPALQGNTYHQDSKGNYIPILPRGDPHGPRPSPRFRVGQEPPKAKDGHKIKSHLKNVPEEKKTLGKPNLVEPPKDPDADLGIAQDDLPDQVVEVETTRKDQKHEKFIARNFNNKEAQEDDKADDNGSKPEDVLDNSLPQEDEDFELKQRPDDDPDALNSINKME